MSAIPTKMIALLAAVLLSALAMTATGAQPIDCAQVENARERLTCFDQQYPRDMSKPTALPAPVDAETPSVSYRKADPAQPPPVAQPDATDTTSSSEGQPKSRGIFSFPEKVNIESTLAAVKNEYQKKMVFRLENGQIWLQTSPRDMPIKEGDKVTIRNGTIGGFILSTAGGASTRVRRIE